LLKVVSMVHWWNVERGTAVRPPSWLALQFVAVFGGKFGFSTRLKACQPQRLKTRQSFTTHIIVDGVLEAQKWR